MNKCPKCGYVELYWRPLKYNTDVEYAHIDNVPFASEVPFGEALLRELDGWVYWRSGKEYIQRLPVERYREWGNKTHPQGTYTESHRTRQKKELELTNAKLLPNGQARSHTNTRNTK